LIVINSLLYIKIVARNHHFYYYLTKKKTRID